MNKTFNTQTWKDHLQKIKAYFLRKEDVSELDVSPIDIDSSPAVGSAHLVTSGGVATALNNKADNSDVTWNIF